MIAPHAVEFRSGIKVIGTCPVQFPIPFDVSFVGRDTALVQPHAGHVGERGAEVGAVQSNLEASVNSICTHD